MVDLAVLAAVVFAFGLVSRRLEGTILTAPIIFVAAGAILGPEGLGLVEFKLEGHTVLLVGEIALAIVLVLLLPRSLRRSPAVSMGWL